MFLKPAIIFTLINWKVWEKFIWILTFKPSFGSSVAQQKNRPGGFQVFPWHFYKKSDSYFSVLSFKNVLPGARGGYLKIISQIDIKYTFIGDAHVYTNHVDALKEQIKREPRTFPTIKINRTVENIEDFKFEDFEVSDYNPYPKIAMEMAV